MKKVLILLALVTLAGASFAAGINDTESTLSDWEAAYDGNVTDLTDVKGFTATYDSFMGLEFETETISNWLYNPNETILVTVAGDFYDDAWARQYPNAVIDFYVTAGNGSVDFSAPFTGTGDYELTLSDVYGVVEGDAFDYADFAILNRGNITQVNGKTITVTFYEPSAEPDPDPEEETVVPEPAAIAYGLVGLAPLFGLKRRIKK